MSVIEGFPTVGVDPDGVGVTHPRWSDGAPILVGDDVMAHMDLHDDDWRPFREWVRGFVERIHTEEVTVVPYGDDMHEIDGVECLPSELRRVEARDG